MQKIQLEKLDLTTTIALMPISSYGLPHSYKDQIPQTSYKVTTKITIRVDIELAKKEIDGTQSHRFFLYKGGFAEEEKQFVSQHSQDM